VFLILLFDCCKRNYYRLEEPILHLLWGVMDGFFAYGGGIT